MGINFINPKKALNTVFYKLPNSFFIPTPIGHYNPDWAIAFYEGKVKHIYFIAEIIKNSDFKQRLLFSVPFCILKNRLVSRCHRVSANANGILLISSGLGRYKRNAVFLWRKHEVPEAYLSG